MKGADFLAKWQARRALLEQLHANVDGAVLCREVLQDFEHFRAAEAEELLTLRDAAEASGYSEDHLGRLVRSGMVPNAGRKAAPRIRRADLPRRPTNIARGPSGTYDLVADARSLAIRRKEMSE